MDTLDWTQQLNEQLTWHWDNHLRPRLDGLTDDEYRWEPVPGCWNLRPRAEARTKMAAGSGDLVLDFELPEPDPPPVTTIAWRLGHILVGIFGSRVVHHFGASPDDHPSDYPTTEWPAGADAMLAALDDGYAAWTKGVASLDEERLARPVGPAEGPYAELPMAALVLHINREVVHHGAEVLLLRDLYRRRG